MKLLIDNQLPIALAEFFRERSHDCVHVLERGWGELSDHSIWAKAGGEERIVVSEDDDFMFLANRPNDTGRLIWVRLGNCRNAALIAAVESVLPLIEISFANGQRIVEVR